MVNRLLNPNESTTFGKSLSLRVDGAIGAMSLSPNGRDAVLAGRRGLFIIDMDDPFTPPRWLHHITSWEVADVQWSPHSLIKPSWCISTSNQKALLWDLSRPSNNAIANILHAHTRAISDINFHPSDPEILATCSIDTFALSWDMRTPRKPVGQWADWRAGAIQVKWNHENPYEIASSHDNSFYVWDTRKGALPFVKVSKAHEGKINGLDFTQGLKNVITCSNDNTIKFWDLRSENAQKAINEFNYFSNSMDDTFKASVVIEADFPIARARTLPFGSDKAVGVMPLRDGQDSIHIVNYEDAYQQYLATNETQRVSGEFVYSFKGHRGPIKDFLWRTKHEKYKYFESKNNWKDYQLVTWSDEDVDLKLWPSDDEIFKSVNYDPTFFNVFKEDQDGDFSAERTPTEEDLHTYETYCCEPKVTIDDVAKTNGGDVLSAITLYQIAEKRKQSGYEFSQLDHLDWISGVRIGHAARGDRKDSSTTIEDEGPSNLGEEVSIVGHKFPFIRFEKISVSTGELVISLRGPTVTTEQSQEKRGSIDSIEASHLETVNSTKDKSVLSEDGKEFDKKSFSDKSIKNANIDEVLDEPIEQKLVFIRLSIDFPKSYPYLEEIEFAKGKSNKKIQKLSKQNQIKFEIEETHELTYEMKTSMEKTISGIANFYTNKYQRFCLEPCLRFLLGEKIELDDELMMEHRRDSAEEDSYLPEVGNEGWVDDLISQQPDFNGYSSGEDNDPEYGDLFPAVTNLGVDANATGQELIETPGNIDQKPPNFDSTPIPKGCGAMWSPTGQLVCFFIPKTNMGSEKDSNESQKFNILKFTDNGFSVKTHQHHNHHHQSTISSDSESEHSDSNESNEDSDEKEGDESSSDEDFEEDLEELLKHDASARNRMPGLLRSNFGLGSRFINNDGSHKSSLKKLTSHGESLSNYKSSLKGEKKKSNGKNKNIVGIFDFSHLLPNRLELAKEYKVVGDTPENLAAHNSRVASKYGLKEVGEVWKILEILLNQSAAGSTTLQPPIGNDQFKDKYLSIWGSHPFGYTWLIQEIFQYYIKNQNTQMLAMMSCILYRSPHMLKQTRSSELLNFAQNHNDGQSIISRGSTMLDQKSEFTYGDHSQQSSGRRKDSRLTNSYAHSLTSSADNISLRTDSPDKYGYSRKFGPSLHSIAAKNGSQNSLFENEIKIPTPKRAIKGIAEKPKIPRKSIGPKWRIDPPPIVTIDLQNEEELDLFEESLPNDLPNFLSDEKMKLYRSLYAETLYDWGLPMTRLEILKFNYDDNPQGNDSSFTTHECRIGLRKRNRQTPNQIFINTVSSVVVKYPNAWNTNKRQLIKYCILCNLAATKNFTLCGNCEHILHTECASEWWSEKNQECASGCGCKCLEQSIYH